MTYRVRNIAIAVALAVVAALLTGFYVTSYKRSVQHADNHVSVLVASQDIPAGTSGADAVGHHFLRNQEVLRGSVVPGAISAPAQLANLVSTQAIYAGEQVTTRRFSAVAQAGVRAQLKGTERAFQFAGDQNQVLAGTLKEGDYVDLVANERYPEGASHHVVRVVLRDLLVLQGPPAVGNSSGRLSGPQGDFPVMVRVTDQQAEKLWFVVKNSDWSLQLRPVVNGADSAESAETVWSVLTDGLPANNYERNHALNYGGR